MRTRRILAPLALLAAALVAWLGLRREPGASGAADSDGAQAFVRADPASLVPPVAPDPRSPDGAQRSGADEPGLDVRVRHAATREPLPGFTAQLRAGGTLVAEELSDARGRLRLPAPPADDASVQLQAPWGWVVLDPLRGVAPGEARPLEFLARPAGFARFRGRIVDAASREPLPAYAVDLVARDSAHERLVSDEQGRVASEREFAEGPLTLYFRDVVDPDLGATDDGAVDVLIVQHEPRAGETAECELAVAAGPTYRLAFEPRVDAGLRMGADLGTPGRWWNALRRAKATPVRWSAAGPWVRFGPAYRNLESAGALLRLAVTSDDGRWAGSADVTSSAGVHPGRVTIALDARGRVLGRVVDRAGEPISGASVRLMRREAGAPGAPLAGDVSGGNGLVEFQFVPAGDYLVEAVSVAHERRFVPLAVPAGERVDLELVLAPARVAGEISGELVAPRDARLERAEVFMFSLRPPGLSFSTTVEMQRSGEVLRGRFAFADVPQGDWRVHVANYGWSAGRITPSSIDVRAPAQGLVFELQPHTKAASGRLFVDARDAATSERIAPLHVEVDSPWAYEGTWALEDENDYVLLRATPEPDARWFCSAAGYAPANGACAEFERDGERLVLRQRLARGWGLYLELRGPGFAPLAGARVLLDGKPAGESDAAGRVALRAASAPARIEVRYLDWFVEPDSLALLVDALDGSSPRVRLLLSPRE